MRTRTALTLLALAAAIGAGGCKSSKSSNPLSPSVAGPIPGVTITTPKLLQPTAGQAIEAAAQPITLLLENASTTGQRPLSYVVEVAMDADFTNKVLSRDGIAAGGNGQTSFKLPDPLAAERTYYWRAKAQDGANSGTFTGASTFSVFTPIVLQAPGLVSPINDAQLADRNLTLVVSNAARSGPVGSIVYEMQVSANDVFSQIVISMEQNEQAGSTKKTAATTLDYDKRYYWRARAWEMTKNMAGPWSAVATFRTPAAPVTTPPTTPPPSGNGGPVKCGGRYPSTGPEIIDCVSAAYPQYLLPVPTRDERVSNAVFLRNRIIETGICGGLDLAWNAKRGNYDDISYDFIVERVGGVDQGHDIMVDWDNNSIPLRLWWGGGTMPFYATYTPRPTCQ